MTKRLGYFMCCLLLVGATSIWASAQDDTTAKSKDDVRTITGCLTKTGSGNEYVLTGTDGSTWEIHSNSSVDLASNVGQKVDVKGVVSNVKMHNMKEDAKQMGSDAGMKNSNTEHGHLKVTDLQKTGESCER